MSSLTQLYPLTTIICVPSVTFALPSPTISQLQLAERSFCRTLTTAILCSSAHQRLQAVQNHYFCIIKQLPFHASITAALGDLHWLSIRDRIESKLCSNLLRSHDALMTCKPEYLSDLLVRQSPAGTLHSSSDNHHLVVPRT